MEKNILFVILARKGSLRIKNKNMKIFNKKPLIAWTIEQALRIKYPDKRVILSSDSDLILTYANKYKNLEVVKRPKALATSYASSLDAIRHIINKLKYTGYIVLLQPTSPLRLDKDVEGFINLILKGKTPCMSVCKCVHNSSLITNNNPPKKFKAINNKKQILYYPNGALYAAYSTWFEKNKTFYNKQTYTYLMPESRSVDIDYDFQFEISEALFKKTKRK